MLVLADSSWMTSSRTGPAEGPPTPADPKLIRVSSRGTEPVPLQWGFARNQVITNPSNRGSDNKVYRLCFCRTLPYTCYSHLHLQAYSRIPSRQLRRGYDGAKNRNIPQHQIFVSGETCGASLRNGTAPPLSPLRNGKNAARRGACCASSTRRARQLATRC